MPTPWLYAYYARCKEEANDVQQRKYCQIAMQQFILIGVPLLLGATWWDTYTVYFRDLRLAWHEDMQKVVSVSVREFNIW